MQNLAFPMKQDFAKPKSFSEKLKFFILQKPLSLKLSTELQKLETEIYETEKSVEKLENEINDFGKNENNFKQFVEKIEDVSVAEILIRKTAKIEEQKTESEKINRKNKISSICTFVLSKQCSELEEILLSLNNKNAFLYSNRLSIDKSLQSLEERHFRDLKRKIEENDERMAKLKEKQKKVNEFEEKKEKEKMRAENELRFGKVYQILSSALGAVPLNLDENGFRFKTGQNRFFVEVLENGKIFVSLLNENGF
ncbi:hypothetical protein MHBO_003904 [Bonamia ostreae]|uniref:Uncharacterized protein n=1 Tax=Bonamia ostreae TaxID=126728 RepID=A0ABV2ASD9_9EUKA